MTKTYAELIFDKLISKIVWPNFKERKYKKAGNNFRFYDTSGWGKIVNFQKSMFYNKEHIHFTINTGLYLAEAEEFHCHKQSFEKFQESMCMVRQRIGYLSNEKKDLWFDIDETTNETELIGKINKYFTDYIIPYLDSVNSRNDIIAFMLNGYKSMYIRAQIQTLYYNNHIEEAKKQLKEALANSNVPEFKETLLEIEQSFKI